MADRLRAGGFQVTAIQGKDSNDAADLARAVVHDGYDALVVMGGDGAVHLALQSVAGSPTRLGIVATGTGNDAARFLGLPRQDLTAAADVIAAGFTRSIDTARIGTTAIYPRLFRGTHTTHPAYEHHRVKQVSVAAPGIVAYADGERLGPLPLTIDVVPSAVTVFAPAS